MKFKVGAPARVGLVAPNSVEVPAGGTGLDPSSTNFFQVCPASFAQHVYQAIRFFFGDCMTGPGAAVVGWFPALC